jgi:hypothetical protein
LGYPGKGIAYLTEGNVPFVNREVGDVDLDRDAEEVPDKKIDSRSSLEGKGAFSID